MDDIYRSISTLRDAVATSTAAKLTAQTKTDITPATHVYLARQLVKQHDQLQRSLDRLDNFVSFGPQTYDEPKQAF